MTANTSVFNLHTAGWVLMLIGLIGLLLPRRNRGWLGRRVVVRARTYPSGPTASSEIPVPPYVARNPGTARIEAGLPARPTLPTDASEGGRPDRGRRPGPHGRPRATAPQTEVIEDLYEKPE